MSSQLTPGVKRKSVGIGDAFQSDIRPVQWADGANHEGFATLLRADGQDYSPRVYLSVALPPLCSGFHFATTR